ncbi:hypothetical protein FHL15_010847 [Xylaria flabelliformis]|uniref:Carrier domain-containing protein n=1 Tax=Xylaria flabelliformis TaxID=2512241 RepID=A0A553HK02_9PEZI|nr:hypothetical protein FHL15_010847 [Xylaria flabelliformis]
MPSITENSQLEWQTPPAGCGKRLPPVLLDEIAAKDPGRVLYSIAKTEKMQDGFQDISYKTVANAVNRLEAHISLVERAGCSALLLPTEPLPIVSRILEAWPMEHISVPDLDYFLDEHPVHVVPFPKTFEEVKNEPFCILHTSGSTGIPKPVPITYGSYGGMDSQLLIPSLGHKPTFVNYVQGKRLFLALPMFHAASLNWTVGLAMFAGVTCVLPPPSPLTADLASQILQYSHSYSAIMAPSPVVDCYNNDTNCMRMLQNLKCVAYVGGMLPEQIGNVLSQRIRLTTLMGSCETALLPIQMLDDPQYWEYISLSPCLGHTFRDDRDGLGNLTIVRQAKHELHQGVFSTFPEKDEHAMGDLFEPHPFKPDLWRFRTRADDIISFTTAEKLNPSTMESTIQANPLVKSAVIGGQGQFQASLLLEPREYPRNAAEEKSFFDQVWPSIIQANRDCPAHGRIMKGFVMLTDPSKPLPRASKDTVQRHAVFKLYEEEWRSLYERQAGLNPSKISLVQSSASFETSQHNLREAGNGMVLTDEMAFAIEAIVERKLSEALDMFTSAIRAAAGQLRSTGIANNLANDATNHRSAKSDHTAHANGLVMKTNGHQKKPVDERLRQIIYDTLAENLEVDNIDDDTDLFKLGLDSLQVPSLLNAINAFIVKSKQPVDLIRSEVVYSNPTIAKLIAVVVN